MLSFLGYVCFVLWKSRNLVHVVFENKVVAQVPHIAFLVEGRQVTLVALPPQPKWMLKSATPFSEDSPLTIPFTNHRDPIHTID